MANLSDYIVNFTSLDTLNSVTGRGATTTNDITIGNLTSTGIDDNATSTAITIDASENVGIGTTSPTAYTGQTNLNINSGGVSRIDFDISDSLQGYALAESGYLGLIANTSNFLMLGAGGAERMRISSAGNVGIGTSSPSHSLDVSTGATSRINTTDGTRTLLSGVWASQPRIETSGGTFSVAASGAYDIAFSTNGSERMRIDSSGNTVAKPSGGEVTLGANGHITSKQSLDVATAGGRYIGASNRGIVGQIRIEQTTTSADGGYVSFDTCASGSTSPTERMRINSSGDVGIGVVPDSFNTVDGALQVGTRNTLTSFSNDIGIGYNHYYNSGWKYANTDVAARFSSNSGIPFLWQYAASGSADGAITWSEAMRIDSSGNLIVGSTSVDAASSVSLKNEGSIRSVHASGAGGDSLFGAISGVSNGYQIVIDTSNNQSYKWHNGGTTSMTLNSSGNLGIATTNPATKLEVAHATTGIANNISVYNSNTAASAECAVDWALERTGSAAKIRAARITAGKEQTWTTTASTVDGYLKFLTVRDESLNEAMRINSSGDLLVGKTSGGVAAAAGFTVQPQGNGGASPFVSSSSDASVNSHITWAAYSRGVSAYRFYVGYGGQIYATSTSISAISDESLKENIRDLDKGLETINALQPRRFDWKNGDGNDIMGFVAQEVEGVLPELVHDYKYSEEETKLGLKMGDMVPSMVKAIQELSAQVNELKAEVAALKGE